MTATMIKQTGPATGQAVEVLGPWLLNKGDVLNLNSIARRLGGSYQLAVSSNLGLRALPDRPEVRQIRWRPDYEEVRAAARSLSFKRGLSIMRRGIGLRMVSDEALRRKRLLDGRALVGLLDCSGFAYGDQWPAHRMKKRAGYYRRLKSRGVKLILLPQAFGPFSLPDIRESATSTLKHFDLIYARDEVSFQHVRSLDLDAARIRIAPDITHLLEGTPPLDPEVWAKRVCLVPNARMEDKTTEEAGKQYAGLMTRAARLVRESGLEPCFVVHESNDRPLVDRLRQGLEFEVPVFDEDALITKGYLGACHAVVGSRYHALLSSLSQGTPCIGTSWNHKYEAMFEDYGCPDMVLSPGSSETELAEKLGSLLTPEGRRSAHQNLLVAAKTQKDKVEQMWQQVEQMLQSGPSR